MTNYEGIQNDWVCVVKSPVLDLSLEATPSPVIFLFAILPFPSLYSIGKSSAK